MATGAVFRLLPCFMSTTSLFICPISHMAKNVRNKSTAECVFRTLLLTPVTVRLLLSLGGGPRGRGWVSKISAGSGQSGMVTGRLTLALSQLSCHLPHTAHTVTFGTSQHLRPVNVGKSVGLQVKLSSPATHSYFNEGTSSRVYNSFTDVAHLVGHS